MVYTMCVLFMGLILGLVAVASNPSPYFAALGLVMVAGMGCGVLAGYGGSFLSLVLFLIYLGGMLVVFAYSAALAAEPYPETLGSRPVVVAMVMYFLGVMCAGGLVWGGDLEGCWVPCDEFAIMGMARGDVGGAGAMYSSGGMLLVCAVWVLLLTLFVVLEITRGSSRGALRAV